MSFETVHIGPHVLYCGDCREVLPTLDVVPRTVTISDPPFNIGMDYGDGSDRMSPDEYWDMLEYALTPASVVIHYPEALFEFAFQIGMFPTKCMAWVYNANTARQWRMAAWFAVAPDFSLVKQPYKNGDDLRIRALTANGSAGRNAYDWMECQQVKNVSDEKTEHPCQMPEAVMDRIVGVSPCARVMDPFMGSGTTGVAVARRGGLFAGIERERRWFDIACRRIEDAHTGGPLLKATVKESTLFEESHE